MDNQKMMLSIMSKANIYAYGINKDNYQLIFMDSKMQKMFKEAKLGDVCYKAFYKRDQPCKTCNVCKGDTEQLVYDPCDGGIWFKGLGYSIELDECKNAAIMMHMPTSAPKEITIVSSKTESQDN